MMIRISLISVFMFLSLVISQAIADDRPNFLIIMLDDMGWSDLACYGGEIQTPHIDSLAANGLRFTNFYNAGRCCPTRASLLTGLYPHQTGLGRMTFDAGAPGYTGQLGSNCVTMAEVLRTAGYHTSMVGKWHLSLTRMGPNHMKALNNQVILDRFADPASYPVGRGFDEHYGIVWGVINYFDPFSLVHNTESIKAVPKDYYITDAFTDRAVQYIDKYSGGDKPFFMYLAHTAPHWPLHALPEDIEKYKDTYKVGWQAIRKARYQRQIKMGLIDPRTTKLSDRHNADRVWKDNPDREWDARAMAVHAAMIDRVDQGVGRIVAKLKQHHLFDNTLIMVLADNGASPETPGAPGFDRTGQTRDGRHVTYYGRGKPKNLMPGSQTTYAGFGAHWANVANTPLRYWKATQHEGGICTPLIVHWPAGLKTRPGAITPQIGHVIDVMATVNELANAKYPDQFKGKQITALEGKSLLSIFRGETRSGHDAVFFEHHTSKAVRRGPWKLVALKGKPWELYDLDKDRTETNNVANQHPQKVRQMDDLWKAWAQRAKVFPLPGKPKKGKR